MRTREKSDGGDGDDDDARSDARSARRRRCCYDDGDDDCCLGAEKKKRRCYHDDDDDAFPNVCRRSDWRLSPWANRQRGTVAAIDPHRDRCDACDRYGDSRRRRRKRRRCCCCCCWWTNGDDGDGGDDGDDDGPSCVFGDYARMGEFGLFFLSPPPYNTLSYIVPIIGYTPQREYHIP